MCFQIPGCAQFCRSGSWLALKTELPRGDVQGTLGRLLHGSAAALSGSCLAQV